MVNFEMIRNLTVELRMERI